MYLYGKARVKYEDFELDAEYIRLDQKNKKIFARGKFDKDGRYHNRPIFKQGSEPPATTDSLMFNIETKKGKSFGGSYEIEGGYIQASQIKKNEFDEGFIKDAIYSTCNLQHPHFGIHITKGIITKKQIVTKVAYLELEGVPLPLGVPFGFFPKTNKRASGILFPTFGEDNARGFFMRDMGYYLGLNDYWDLAGYTSLYSKGSYEFRVQSRYQKRYKYDGSLGLRFSSTKAGIEGTPGYKPLRDFNVQWSHSQRPEVNPGTTFSAQVNAGTSSYFQNTAAGGTYDINQLTRNSLSSGINYSKNAFGPNKIFNFSSSLSHRQEVENRNIYLELPRFNFSMNTINPFDSKDRVGEQKWYQRINVGYTMDGSNSIDTKDTLLFKRSSLKNFRNDVQHNIPVSFSTNILKFFQFSTGGTYRENWYLQTIRKGYSDTLKRAVITDTVRGFSRVYQYGISASLSTKIYGTKVFKRGKLMAIRHVLTPSVGVSYNPDFGSDRFGFYRNVQADTTGRNFERYSIFETGAPGPGRQASLNFSFDNNIEAKVRSTKDTVNNFVKVPLLQGLSFSGNYNFAADSFKLSNINFYGRTSLFKQKVGINFNGTLDPYRYDQLGNRLNELAISTGKIARLANFGISTDYSLNLNSTAIKRRNSNNDNRQQGLTNTMTPQQADQLALVSRDPNGFVDFNVPWDIIASYNFNFNYSRSGRPSIVNTLNVNGNFNVTPKWKVGYTTGYDFTMKELNITQFNIYRDLHCWDLSFSWIPFGIYKSYTVDLKVKASILQDLKLSRRKSHFDNF